MLPYSLQSNPPSYHLFSIYSLLAQFSSQFPQSLQFNNNNSSVNKQSIEKLQQDFTRTISGSPPTNKYETLLFNFLKARAIEAKIKDNQEQRQSCQQSLTLAFKAFLLKFSQTRCRIPNLQNLAQSNSQVKLIIADKKKLYSLRQQMTKKQSKMKTQDRKQKLQLNQDLNKSYRAYVIYGKAVNVQRKKKNTSNSTQTPQPSSSLAFQDLNFKQQVASQLQQTMTRLYQQQKLAYVKSQPHQLEDILLSHYLDDATLLPIVVTNQVYRLFIPLDFAIVLAVPQQKMQTTNASSSQQHLLTQIPMIIKSTLLHVFVDNHRALVKTTSKQSFFKNSTFRGIYFVEQGQVQTKSGRIVARGWVVNGKCRSSTQAWRFHRVMSFWKFILTDQNVWKQFLNDLKLNGEWPPKVQDILNIDQGLFEEIMGGQGSKNYFGYKNQRNKKIRFPPISGGFNKSFDVNKLLQIQKMKHYNQKMNHLSQFKQQMLKRKIQLNCRRSQLKGENQPNNLAAEKEMKKKIHILSQKYSVSHQGTKNDSFRNSMSGSGQSSANILITGIVKKLKSMHESSANNSSQTSGRNFSKQRVQELNLSKSKILGLKRYEQLAKNEKSHRYKGKNVYH